MRSSFLGFADVYSQVMAPTPPVTVRTIPSMSWTSSMLPVQSMTRRSPASSYVPAVEIVRRGPRAKNQVTPSERPSGWHPSHDPHAWPLKDQTSDPVAKNKCPAFSSESRVTLACVVFSMVDSTHLTEFELK